MPGRKLYVGGLPYAIDDQGLYDLFAPHGTVDSARVITDRETGQSRGFGFVEMSSPDEAAKAREELDKSIIDGRTLSVDEARPQVSRGGGGGGGGGRY